MYLEKIEIQGFKSFAQKTTLHFPKETIQNKGITAIVGPNGSGKSNISDAVRWVLGEQSAKTLRAKKGEDVIFQGSEKKSRLGFAEVSLYLNNESGQAPIDYSEIVITRRLYRDGESEYLLNKNRVRLVDIQMLLAKARIGQRTYSVIGQGMIDYFLIAPPGERKEFFDEAAGIKEYQIKRNQALNKLINTYENLTKADMLLEEIEPRLKSLTRQMKRLEKREILIRELHVLQNSYFGNIKSRLEKEAAGITNKLSDLEENYNLLNQEISKIEKDLANSRQDQSRNEIFDELKLKYNNFIEEKNILLRKQTVVKGSKEIEYKKIGKTDIIWLEKKYDEIKKDKEQILLNLKNLTGSLAALKEKTDAALADKKTVDIKKIETENKLNELQLSFLPKEISGAEFRIEIEAIHKEYGNLIEKIDSIKSLEELAPLKKEADLILEKLSVLISKISDDKISHKEELTTLKAELGDIISKKEHLVAEYNNLIIELNAKRERENVLKESLEKITQEEENIGLEIKEAKAKPADNKEILAKLDKENEGLEKKISGINLELFDISASINDFNKKEEGKKEKLFNLQRQYQEKQHETNKLSGEINLIKINLAKIETRREDLENEIKEVGLIIDHEIEKIDDPERLLPEINKIKNQLEIIGGIDPETQNEYKETSERFEFLSTQVEDLKKAITSLEKIINELDGTIKEKFEKSFNEINKEFQKYFQMLFKGGNAKLVKIEEPEEEEAKNEQTNSGDGNAISDLESSLPSEGRDSAGLEDSENSFVSQQGSIEKNPLKKYKQKVVFGIDIKACPPGKKVSNINMLSGGERTLTSIALLCAIISNNPAPFIFLDEVDAALDEANSHKMSNILDELSHKSQFIIITHNRATMQKAELLYGVTMGEDGVSKLLSIKFEDASKVVRR
ncbi:MAG: AAA family ATPase [bacterium]